MRKLGGYYRRISISSLGEDGVRASFRIKCKRCGWIYKAVQFWFWVQSWWETGNRWETPHCPKCKLPFILSET